MLDAERVVFLVTVGLSLFGLCFGATTSVASGFDAVGAPRLDRVRVGVSS
jgi:hypothetical protein